MSRGVPFEANLSHLDDRAIPTIECDGIPGPNDRRDGAPGEPELGSGSGAATRRRSRFGRGPGPAHLGRGPRETPTAGEWSRSEGVALAGRPHAGVEEVPTGHLTSLARARLGEGRGHVLRVRRTGPGCDAAENRRGGGGSRGAGTNHRPPPLLRRTQRPTDRGTSRRVPRSRSQAALPRPDRPAWTSRARARRRSGQLDPRPHPLRLRGRGKGNRSHAWNPGRRCTREEDDSRDRNRGRGGGDRGGGMVRPRRRGPAAVRRRASRGRGCAVARRDRRTSPAGRGRGRKRTSGARARPGYGRHGRRRGGAHDRGRGPRGRRQRAPAGRGRRRPRRGARRARHGCRGVRSLPAAPRHRDRVRGRRGRGGDDGRSLVAELLREDRRGGADRRPRFRRGQRGGHGGRRGGPGRPPCLGAWLVRSHSVERL